MSPLQNAVPEAAVSYPVYVDAGLFSPFNLKRALYWLLVPLSLLASSVHQGHVIRGLVLLVVTSLPLRPRCRVEAWGMRIWWLMVQERVRWDDIVAVELADDRRWGVIGKRAPVLTIERKGRPRLTLRGRTDVLAHLTAELADRP